MSIMGSILITMPPQGGTTMRDTQCDALKVADSEEQKFAEQYAEIVRKSQIVVVSPLPENTSLAQPLPYKTYLTYAASSAYQKPITG